MSTNFEFNKRLAGVLECEKKKAERGNL